MDIGPEKVLHFFEIALLRLEVADCSMKKLWNIAWDIWSHRNSIIHNIENFFQCSELCQIDRDIKQNLCWASVDFFSILQISAVSSSSFRYKTAWLRQAVVRRRSLTVPCFICASACILGCVGQLSERLYLFLVFSDFMFGHSFGILTSSLFYRWHWSAPHTTLLVIYELLFLLFKLSYI